MCIEQPRKCFPCLLTSVCFLQQVVILAEKDSSRLRGTVKQFRIVQFCSAVFLCREEIDAPQSQAVCDGRADMHVHVQADGHGSFPSRFNRCRPGEFSVPLRC